MAASAAISMLGLDLRESPFYVLALSPRANRTAIAEAFELAFEGGPVDETAATRAQQTLMERSRDCSPSWVGSSAWLPVERARERIRRRRRLNRCCGCLPSPP